MLLAFLKNLLLVFQVPSDYRYRPLREASIPDSEIPVLQFEYECVEEGWHWADLEYEVKVDTGGLIYFKINRVWVLQPHIHSISFLRD